MPDELLRALRDPGPVAAQFGGLRPGKGGGHGEPGGIGEGARPLGWGLGGAAGQLFGTKRFGLWEDEAEQIAVVAFDENILRVHAFITDGLMV